MASSNVLLMPRSWVRAATSQVNGRQVSETLARYRPGATASNT